jgi:hypothetical protein
MTAPSNRLGHLFVQAVTLPLARRPRRQALDPPPQPARSASLPDSLHRAGPPVGEGESRVGLPPHSLRSGHHGPLLAPSSVFTTLQPTMAASLRREVEPTSTGPLSSQAKILITCDFFDAIPAFPQAHILVFIHHDSRFIRSAGITSNAVASSVPSRLATS